MKTEKSLSLFSDETLDSVVMSALVGGMASDNCHGGNCTPGCSCSDDVCVVVNANTNVSLVCSSTCGAVK